MEISFYKNLEFLNTSLSYEIGCGNKLGEFYVGILNEYAEIIKWLMKAIDKLKKSKDTFYLDLPANNEKSKAYPFIEIIETTLKSMFKKEKQDLKDYEKMPWGNIPIEYYQVFKPDEKMLEKKEKLEKYIINKTNYINYINDTVKFLEMHRSRIDSYINREKLCYGDFPRNKIKLFISPKVDIPSHVKQLYFEIEGSLKQVETVNLNSKELTKEGKRLIDSLFKNSEFDYVEKYNILEIKELMSIYYDKTIHGKIQLKKCKNCGRYFIPHNKQIYCDNPSPQNQKITCRLLPDDMKLKKDSVYVEYRKAYQTQHNKLGRNIKIGNIPESKLRNRFNNWNNEALIKRETCKTPEEFKKWYKTSQNWM